jgi:prophage regulatory protein
MPERRFTCALQHKSSQSRISTKHRSAAVRKTNGQLWLASFLSSLQITLAAGLDGPAASEQWAAQLRMRLAADNVSGHILWWRADLRPKVRCMEEQSNDPPIGVGPDHVPLDRDSPDSRDRRKDRLLRIKSVMARTGLSVPTIYRRESEGTFPKREPIGVRSVAWYESDIDDFVANPRHYRSR